MSKISPETIEAAAERKRRHAAAEIHSDEWLRYVRQDCGISQEDHDNATLADAYLACLAAENACGGPISAERMTLDELLEILGQWKEVASGQTCVSFVQICYGSSSLWHQTHRQNFRAVDRKPDALSEWVLDHEGCLKEDFPAQVLEVLKRLAKGGA